MKNISLFLIVIITSFFIERQLVSSKKDLLNYSEENAFVDQSENSDFTLELDFDSLFLVTSTSLVFFCVYSISFRQTIIPSDEFVQKTPYYLLFQSLKIG